LAKTHCPEDWKALFLEAGLENLGFGTKCVGYYEKDPITGKAELVDILKEGDQRCQLIPQSNLWFMLELTLFLGNVWIFSRSQTVI